MTVPTPTTYSYATVADYELRTGTTVDSAQSATVQQRMDDYSALMALYMGPCEPAVAAQYPDILTSLTVTGVQRGLATTPGVKSSSVGATAVSYMDHTDDLVGGLYGPDRDVLDALMAACCPNWDPGAGGSVGMIGVQYDDGVPHGQQVWVLSRW